jgi:hypothetical protein
MYPATDTSSQQIFAVVGSAYISEHHGDETHRYLSLSERESLFDDILKALRGALSGCRKH